MWLCSRLAGRMERLSAETKQDLEQNRQDLEKAVGRCRAQQLVLRVWVEPGHPPRHLQK